MKKLLPQTMFAIGLAAILVSGIAVGSLTNSEPQRDGIEMSADEPRSAVARGARSYRACAGCGVVQSTRKIVPPDATAMGGRTPASSQGYEITVLLQDGSTRVITDTNPAQWKYGERVSIIAGIDE